MYSKWQYSARAKPVNSTRIQVDPPNSCMPQEVGARRIRPAGQPQSHSVTPLFSTQYPTHYLGKTGWIHSILMDYH